MSGVAVTDPCPVTFKVLFVGCDAVSVAAKDFPVKLEANNTTEIIKSNVNPISIGFLVIKKLLFILFHSLFFYFM
jgi:hypothetical protein